MLNKPTLQDASVSTRDDTESAILETARVAPTGAANPAAIKISEGEADARRELQPLAFCADAS